MHITPILNYKTINNPKNQSKKQDNVFRKETQLPKLCPNQIYFGAGLSSPSERIFKNLNSMEKEFSSIFSPAKTNYINGFGDDLAAFFNKFYNQACENVSIKFDGKNPSFIIKGLDTDEAKYSIELSKTFHNNEEFLKISTSKNDASEEILLVNKTKILTPDSSTPLNTTSLHRVSPAKIFEEEKVNEILSLFNGFVNSYIFNNVQDYFMKTFKNSKNIIAKLDSRLKKLEPEKMHALKNSYTGYVPYPGKVVFQLKTLKSAEDYSLALVPHKKDNPDFTRLLKIDRNGDVVNAYLIHSDKGILNNYCIFKKYNNGTLQHTPPHIKLMGAEELSNSDAVKILTEYYNLLTRFEEHVEKNIDSSTKVLQEQRKTDHIGFNSIKRLFVDNVDEILKNSDFTLKKEDGTIQTLSRAHENNLDVITLKSQTGGLTSYIKINAENAKIFQTNVFGDIMYNKNGTPEYIYTKGSQYELKSGVLKSFIREALKSKPVDINEVLQANMLNLKETFIHADEIWKNVSLTKKTAAIKTMPNFVEARGNAGELRFRIPEKDYCLGLKPQRAGSFEFMRLSVYSQDGKLQKAFLINDFTKIVDNYCTKGYTKDSISKIPKSILYKNEEQINSENIPQMIKEYLKELKNFENIAGDISVDKRLKTT